VRIFLKELSAFEVDAFVGEEPGDADRVAFP
jgi:hypothetical protein